MHKQFAALSALFAAVAVALGAFAAHGLKQMYSLEELNIFETGVKYQMYHALGLGLVAIYYNINRHKFIKLAGWLFVTGMLIFSGSLYVLSYCKFLQAANWYWLGAITPLGGLCFIFGWAILFFTFIRK
jgi:uncharacterized membrane protein YgdD (TMEM256/DUF423 family)